MPVDVAEVTLWGRTIGAVSWDRAREIGYWEYTREFQRSGIELAPITMPLGSDIYSFPNLNRDSFHGLPGLLADSLPDKFGNALIDQWLTRSGRDRQAFSPVERLCYIGSRGMGALEFRPALRTGNDRSSQVAITELVQLASDALSQKRNLSTRLKGKDKRDEEAIRDILRVGTSAGGARAKAIIAWNEATGEVRSGQVNAPEGFTYWLLKFDGVTGNRDKELNDPKGYGQIEYAYYLMAREAGVHMSECRLMAENDRRHFMTKRFDRGPSGERHFMQSLCSLGHFDFNAAGAYSYEEALQVGQQLRIGVDGLRQMLIRCMFNVMARNQDDHTKNIAFLMDKRGRWTLTPAFDVTYAYNPDGQWTSQHQMTLAGKRDAFVVDDFYAIAKLFRLGRISKIDDMLARVDAALNSWPRFAMEAGVEADWAEAIQASHRRLADLN